MDSGEVGREVVRLRGSWARTSPLLPRSFTAQFKRILGDVDVEVVLTPKQAPNCNAYAERFVLSIKSECMRRMIFFGEGSLRRAVSEYVDHYHVERAHQGIGNERIERVGGVREGGIVCDERLGGLLKCYRRAA